MKWFEKHTIDRNALDAKQIRQEFGIAGYGIYEVLQQIVAENMEGDDVGEWGFVAKTWTMESLAEEVGCSDSEFRAFIKFCNDRFIIEKRNGRMFIPKLLERMNEYAKRQYWVAKNKKAKKPDNTDNPDTTEITEYRDNRDNRDNHDNRDKPASQHNTTQHNTINNNLTKVKLVQAPQKQTKNPQKKKPDKRNPVVDHTLEEFKRVYGFYPTDKRPRFVANNLIQRIKRVTADRFGGELTDERISRGITKFFNWLADQESLDGIQKLETAKLKINIFMETLPQKGGK